MGKPILEITLQLRDGRAVTGRSRNAPATLERLYNQALNLEPKRRLRRVEGLGKWPSRYLGAHRAQFGYQQGSDIVLDQSVEFEAKVA